MKASAQTLFLVLIERPRRARHRGLTDERAQCTSKTAASLSTVNFPLRASERNSERARLWEGSLNRRSLQPCAFKMHQRRSDQLLRAPSVSDHVYCLLSTRVRASTVCVRAHDFSACGSFPACSHRKRRQRRKRRRKKKKTQSQRPVFDLPLI